MITLLVGVVCLCIGLALGRLSLRWYPATSAAEEMPPAPVASATPGGSRSPERMRVRFRFADGRVENKRMFTHSLETTMVWRDRPFAMHLGMSSPEVAVYTEVLSRG